jgi:hypothetical protein
MSSSPVAKWRCPSCASVSATRGVIGTERTFPDFGVVSAPPTSANVAPVWTMPASVPRRASSSVWRSQSSAVRLMK